MRDQSFDAPEYFGARADTYENEAFGDSLGLEYINRFEQRAVQLAVGDVKGQTVLDAGAGTGRITRLLGLLGASVVSLDASPEMLRQCALSLPSAQLAVAEVGALLPFRSHIFDAVVCIRVMKYVTDWDLALTEFKRVLKPGGVLALEITNAVSIARFGYASMPIHFGASPQVRAMLKRYGFRVLFEFGGPKLPYGLYRNAKTLRRLKFLRAGETILNLLGSRFLARSLIIGAEIVN